MISKKQAMEAEEFHYANCSRHIGPRGGVTEHKEVWRRNGKTQTWKTRPSEFRVPLKYGLYAYGQLWHHDAGFWHTAEDCPLNHTDGEVL